MIDLLPYCGMNISKKEYEDIRKFENEHKKCDEKIQYIITPTGGIGCTLEVRCTGCGAFQDVTDVSTW